MAEGTTMSAQQAHDELRWTDPEHDRVGCACCCRDCDTDPEEQMTYADALDPHLAVKEEGMQWEYLVAGSSTDDIHVRLSAKNPRKVTSEVMRSPINLNDLQEVLNAYGEEGWEVIDLGLPCIFKRLVEEQRK